MGVSDQEYHQAISRGNSTRAGGYAVSARFNRRRERVAVMLNTGLELNFPVRKTDGLADAKPEELEVIEITPDGLGLHWPKLDADVYIPALLKGVLGSKKWMAREMGIVGGRSRSTAKAAAARANGRKGGRPKKEVAAEVPDERDA